MAEESKFVELYQTFTESGQLVIETEDIFKALDKLKLQSPKATLIRKSDGVLLAHTTVPSSEESWLANL